jgi:tRNA A37 methylthiotransferase MiaB
MKRKYGAEDASACLEKISRLPAPAGGAFVGMDVITGFPGETAEEFDWTLNRLRESPWNRLHVFPYSERSGTPATRLPGAVPQAERVRRGKLLRELSLERLTARHREVLDVCRREGKALEGALLESRVPGPDGSSLWFAGYTRNYLRVIVRAEAGEDLGNQVADVHPTDLIVDRNAGDAALLCTR